MTRTGAGRPRDPAIDAAVLAATLEVLRETGYFGFALEQVAARAGTTKASIRRRWPVRQNLIIDALTTVLVTPPVPDNNCTRCDLMQTAKLLATALHERLPDGVLAPLIADCSRTPELRQRLVDVLLRPSRDAATTAVRRAVDRGDLLPDVDADLLVDILASTVYQRALLGDTESLDVGKLVDQLLRGVAVDYERLVWISRQPAETRHLHQG
ncbi:TetR/AcrR family transcriptional regulator [Stackebrandtia nassauensis]|uniref:Regulatory protein TetR n=1 Tax=Stackebrandtia nassauensis (strain DSM 44728 / CIP 108903 / NRRL B-16338 / NBRC 102104 / LLR-40K-21) TaxID=446470 RepID=D3PXC1_STANL|nr:TetR/AcrR family transcriptional regulator [Stackebrandtia nassauensis]ADD41384.1 regulatory protein TetR [Stackebrandtia nassauensis DSM 44728]